ncbi:hypothetical protein CcaverHIS002_0308450 [Cutaneotrichosporon cavernicola]|uniref:Glycosyl transferase CAP10 domain-containing protein n=1 Tax=Cutaneotrichosporon cavernicola TaxID=279322 RepID=A0AA48I7K7_9TREE|nr:uncharacterized protein CcaverHIS019_0308320 [Cutaneotrichosporon cavernicola]BEI82977.1 hypothetical protein CcaverHIS002_0308450 [Cutaneotrichosporon cavernicola]BEI90762.1 hypothetical protein CcaverHIS019_0308320 [Cutaneotrichosporon cavernicola]BEI98542.1 hypothetical protein CcaverHIS631_0308410 [Cutaneotrichosporon cavernicola]BEJ06313.1 hypothetical protein CcaverHIS641_0308350 [Cutaneotrichosporon cavernicola]
MGLPLKRLPQPRRLLMIGGVIAAIFLMLHIFAPSALPPILAPGHLHLEPDAPMWSSSKWIPPLINGGLPKMPDEYGSDGTCRFLSVVEALSPQERALAEGIKLTEVSPGIVQVNNASSQGAHPILGLIVAGERHWGDLMNRQSKTLEDAYKVYVTKWGRPPPKGFDDWWSYAATREVLLIDEFDIIMESLMPYYGLEIKELQTRNADLEKVVETFTLIVTNGKVEVQWNDNYARDRWWSTRPRADAQVNLMEKFLHLLPNFRATFSIHDQPMVMLNHDVLQKLNKAASDHKVVTNPGDVDTFKFDWKLACPNDSPLRKQVKEEAATDTFVSDHLKAMNPCDHPSLLENHGMFLEEHVETSSPKPHTKLLPIFSLSKTSLNQDILVTPVGKDGEIESVGNERSWNKKNGKMYWRGLATGMFHNKKAGHKWRQSHRERLHFLANDRTGREDEVTMPVGATGQTKYERHSLKALGEYYTNSKLAQGPWQCDEGDGTCAEMQSEIDFAPKDPMEESNNYKYLLDIDGNAWSSRFPRLMRALNVKIRATVFPEWNSLILPAWFAYVPVKMDYSDLYSVLAFFRGSLSGRGSHDEVARRIARNGQCWVERTLRREDLEVYMFRLYLEWARLVSDDRDNGKMDFELQPWHKGKPDLAADLVKPGIDS